MTNVKNNTVVSVRERISDVAQQWFLMEPLLFAIYCTHELTLNNSIKVPLRTGGGLIEYNESLLTDINDAELTGRLMVEALRILLKHPYVRQPFGARPEILFLASNMTILDNAGDSNRFNFELVPLSIKNRLPKGQTFEEYYGLLNMLMPPQDEEDSSNPAGPNDTGQGSSDSGAQDGQSSLDSESPSDSGGQDGQGMSDSSNSGKRGKTNPLDQKMKEWADAASTWKEDSISTDNINTLIEMALSNPDNQWGTIKGNYLELIKASLVTPVNVANILKGFKKTVLSQRRDLTRMRPSRRYGFEQMGSKYAYTTRILVAIDTSGSVNSYMLTRMLGLVNRIFKQGIEQIDVIQFDFDLQGKPISIRKCIRQFEIFGRGGTNFQVPADYYMEHREYDGLIYITDGEAPAPIIPPQYKRLPVAWIITDDDLIPTVKHGWERMDYVNHQ